jgi:predicted transcriptional regulator
MDGFAEKEAEMNKHIVKQGTAADFFARGREIARVADRGERIKPQFVITFEDPEDMMQLVTAAKVNLFHTIKAEPGSITAIATRLKRDRSAVQRDITALAKAGLVSVTEKALAGHGRQKEVRALADRFRLQVEIA